MFTKQYHKTCKTQVVLQFEASSGALNEASLNIIFKIEFPERKKSNGIELKHEINSSTTVLATLIRPQYLKYEALSRAQNLAEILRGNFLDIRLHIAAVWDVVRECEHGAR